MSTPLLQITDLRTAFGRQIVHKDVSFTVQRGVVAALIGGSGSGKTVLLREVLGLLKPQEGEIKLFGKNVWDQSEEELDQMRRDYSVLFQSGALFSSLTVEENISLPIRLRLQLPAQAIRETVTLKLALSGLEPDVARKMPSQLSGGMQKRVALARALALEPKLLFLDEPTAGLDPINARSLDQLIKTLCKAVGLTVFMITHDLDSILGIADQVIVLGEGHVLAEGSVSEVQREDHPWIKEYFSARAG